MNQLLLCQKDTHLFALYSRAIHFGYENRHVQIKTVTSTLLMSNFLFLLHLQLELEQHQYDKNGKGDLDRAMKDAADEFDLGLAIPSPHVTALYGIDSFKDEGEMLRVFREDVMRILLTVAEERSRRDGVGEVGKIWPDLDATGILVGAEFDGVDGGTMVSSSIS